MKKKIKVVLIVLGFILITEILDILIFVPNSTITHSEFVDAQVKNHVNGVLIDVASLSKGLSEFVLKNTETKIRMSLYNYDYNCGQYFGNVAQPGDSVYKAKGSDTLYLYKSNKVIPFVIF